MLDVIIPTYKNPLSLDKTLQTIPRSKDVIVTVIDDATPNSVYNFHDDTNFYQLPTNVGPGMVRQYGMEHTKEPYIMFIDTGDLVESEQTFAEALAALGAPNIWIYYWPHFQEVNGKLSSPINNRLHGRIYNRAFLEAYDITFCREGSYYNEDIGFNRKIRMLIKHQKRRDNIERKLSFTDPLVRWTYDEFSITRNNNRRAVYLQQNNGLALNEIDVYKWACAHGIDRDIIEEESCDIMTSLYYDVIRTEQERPEYLEAAIAGARLYYTTIFRDNIDMESDCLTSCIGKQVTRIHNMRAKWPNLTKPINFRKFLQTL